VQFENIVDGVKVTHSLAYSLTYSLTHLLNHSLTHLLTHSLTIHKNALDSVIGVNITWDKKYNDGMIGAFGASTSLIWLWQHYWTFVTGKTLAGYNPSPLPHSLSLTHSPSLPHSHSLTHSLLLTHSFTRATSIAS
jgi:hypothetical protein